MLTRLIATVAALLLACASPQAQAHVRAERVSVSLADLVAIERSAEDAPPAKTNPESKTAPPARATVENSAPRKNAALSHCRVGENWSPLQKCASMPGVYQWDGTRLAGRTNATGSTLGDYQHAYGWAISSREGAVRSTLHTDVHGTPQLITDGTGAIAGWTRTDVWGVEKASTGAQSRLGHTGYLKDPLLGDELYAQARQYRAGVGRFTTVDEWEGDVNNPISLNKYLYVFGNPGTFTDPDGRCVEPATAVLCALGAAAAATWAVDYGRMHYFGTPDEQANAGTYATQNTANAVLVAGTVVAAAALAVETGGASLVLAQGFLNGGRVAGLQAAYVANAPRIVAAADNLALTAAGFAGADVPSASPAGIVSGRASQLMAETAGDLDARLARMVPELRTADDIPPAPTSVSEIVVEQSREVAPLLLTHTPTTNTLAKIRRMASPQNWRAGEEYVQELYGSKGQQHYPVPAGPYSGETIVGTGGRHVDAPVLTAHGGVMANEVKTYKEWLTVNGQPSQQAVPLSDKIRQQVLKDRWLRDNVPGYDPRYIFLHAPPSTELSQHLSDADIIHVIHH